MTATPAYDLTARLQDIRERDLGAGQLGDVDRGAVLNRPSSVHRPGRRCDWLKHKARHTADGVLLAVRHDRDGQWHGICDVGGRRVVALAGASSVDQVGGLVSLVYSRVDADGGKVKPTAAQLAERPWLRACASQLLKRPQLLGFDERHRADCRLILPGR